MVRRSFAALILAFVALSPAGAFADPVIYLSTLVDNKVYKVLPDGSKTAFGPALAGGSGMAFDQQNNYLYAANYSGGSLYKIAPDGTFTTYATGLSAPYGVAVDGFGNVFVSNAVGNTITKILPDVSHTKITFATGLNQPQDMVFDDQGYLYLADPQLSKVFRYDSLGTRTDFISSLTLPVALARNSNGHFFISQWLGGSTPGGIVEYDASGAFVGNVASGLDGIYDLAVGLDGKLYVTTYPAGGSSTQGKILQIAPGGSPVVYASNLFNPTGLAIPVPEPASLAITGVAGLLLVKRRRKLSA